MHLIICTHYSREFGVGSHGRWKILSLFVLVKYLQLGFVGFRDFYIFGLKLLT